MLFKTMSVIDFSLSFDLDSVATQSRALDLYYYCVDKVHVKLNVLFEDTYTPHHCLSIIIVTRDKYIAHPWAIC